MHDKIEVSKEVGKLDLYDFDGDLNRVLEKLGKFKEDTEFTRFSICHEEESGYYHEVYHSFIVTGYRWETDVERDDRLKMIEEMGVKNEALKIEDAKRKEAKDRAEYRKLKKRFEGE